MKVEASALCGDLADITTAWVQKTSARCLPCGSGAMSHLKSVMSLYGRIEYDPLISIATRPVWNGLAAPANWHPHTYEVLGGGLVAPAMDGEAEMEFMNFLLTTWGKTWHTWPDPTTRVPLGEPLLMWSLTGDGQADKELVAERDKAFGVSTAEVRAKRVQAIEYEVPQVPPPTSIATIGRQWTAAGDDKPTPPMKSRARAPRRR